MSLMDWIIFAFFMINLVCATGLKSYVLDSVVYVSRVRGKTESDRCGSKSLPCKTLQVGIDKLAWGGQLYVDGDHTLIDPYKCESSTGKTVVQKSLSIQSYTSTAHISCVNGFNFTAANRASVVTNVTITGVQFKNTTVHSRNANLKIQDCAFLESSPAIDVKISNDLPFYSLDIKNTVFESNQGCIDIIQENSDQETTHILMRLSSVVFKENSAHRENIASGLVFVKHNSSCKDVSFSSTWDNVTAIRNQGRVSAFDYVHREREQSNPNSTTMSNPKYASTRHKTSPDPILNSLFVVYTCNANLTFDKVRSDYNDEMRYLGLKIHGVSYLRISNSSFHNHTIKGPGGVVYIPDGKVIDVDIGDSNFTGNRGSIGGFLHIDDGYKKTVILKLSKVIFLYCSGSVTGCVVSVGSPTKRGVANAFIIFKGVLVDHCHSKNKLGDSRFRYGPLCLRATGITDVIIRDSIFRRNVNRRASAAYIKHCPKTRHTDSKLHVQVISSKFDQNSCDTRKAALRILIENPTWVKSSRLTISNSIFTRNKGMGVEIDNIQEIKLLNFTCNYTKGYCYSFYLGKREKLKNTPPGLNASCIIENSTFSSNYQSVLMKYVQPNFLDIQVRNTIFVKNRRGSPVFFQFGSTELKNLKMIGRVLFENICFISNIKDYGKTSAFLFTITVPESHIGNLLFVFRQFLFKDNFHKMIPRNPKIPEALFFFQTPEDHLDHSNKKCSIFPLYNYTNTFIFEDVIFENNLGPAVTAYIANGKTTFNRCLFKNNYSHKPSIGAHLFIQEGTSSVEFRDTNFIQTKPKTISLKPRTHSNRENDSSMLFVFAGSRGPLVIRNSRFIASDSSERAFPHFTIQSEGYVFIDNHTSLMCPIGSDMSLEDGSHIIHSSSKSAKINITQLKFICKMCGVGEYSLERGSYQGKLRPIKCLEFCPFGGDCTWNIASRSNFWGYYTTKDPPQLNFTRCPEKYCLVPKSKTNSSVYNRCSGFREGTMCGACKQGYSESMFNHNCRPNNECRDCLFWIIAGLYSLIIAWYLLCRPPIVSYVINQLLWFKNKKSVVPNIRYEENKNTDGHDEHGYSKIIFYFYQVADLLMLESSSEVLHKQTFLSSVISFYNFEIKVADSSFGCPFPGLTAVTKELFLSLQVFVVMVALVLFYFANWLLRSIRKKPRPHFAPYLASIVEVLLLGYERLGHTSLELLNCAPLNINGKVEWRLELDGNVTCWVHWWQYALIAYNIIFFIPFLLVLLVGTSKLRRQKIGAFHFVAACMVPLPFLVYWLIKRLDVRSNNYSDEITHAGQGCGDQERRKALLDVLQGPFRPPTDQSRDAYYWESILIGRRLVLLCLHSFISTPMLRMLFMTAVCMAILVHNIVIIPYKDKKIHFFGITLLSMHVAIAIVNLCKSVLDTVGVIPTGPTRAQIDGLELFEVALLGALPCIFGIVMVVVLLSQIGRVFVMFKYLIRCCIKREDEKKLLINSHDDDCYRPFLISDKLEDSLYND